MLPYVGKVNIYQDVVYVTLCRYSQYISRRGVCYPMQVKSIYIKTWCMLPYGGKINIYQDVVYVTLCR